MVTDYHAIMYAINKANLNLRIACWTIRLQSYDFNVQHRQGNRMMHVDTLRRIVASVETIPLEKELQYRQLLDSRIRAILDQLEVDELERITLKNFIKSNFYVLCISIIIKYIK